MTRRCLGALEKLSDVGKPASLDMVATAAIVRVIVWCKIVVMAAKIRVWRGLYCTIEGRRSGMRGVDLGEITYWRPSKTRMDANFRENALNACMTLSWFGKFV